MTDGGRVAAAEPADGLAPVIPLFGAGASPVVSRAEGKPGHGRTPRSWHTTWTDEAAGSEPLPADEAESRERAEAALLKKLRMRSLSVREARAVLIEQGLVAGAADDVVDGLVRHGYLDDLRLAEQLVHAGVDRKGQGRRAIAQSLAQRGIPREVAEAALAETDDDDAERALAFARQKARAFRDLDRDAALRRLVGQLSRRGYPGQVSMAAARQALDEVTTRGVRFE